VTARPIQVLGIPGSLRRGSYNRLLLEEARASSPPGMTIAITDALLSIPPFNEDLEAASEQGPEGVEHLWGQVASADGVLIATPEYNQSVPGVLKNAIDWLSRPRFAEALAGKPVALIGATAGRWGTRLAQSALRHVLYATESAVLPSPALFLADAGHSFDASGRLVDGAVREQLQRLLAAFIPWIEGAARGRGVAAP
jgi:chromate reductase, NAD(P)H dehydrogenase (quinone)